MKALATGPAEFARRPLISRHDDPVVLTRSTERPVESPGVDAVVWNLAVVMPSEAIVDGVETVFHLARDPVAD